jgi:non-homologous end joining protein Ku
MVDAFKTAQKIVEHTKLKKCADEVIDWYNEELRDVIVIFVTDDWHADTFWQKLEVSQVINVLEALQEGLEECEDME